jgi:hypothetical protein
MPQQNLLLDLTIRPARIRDRYWTRILALVENGACSHWASVRRSRTGSPDDPHSQVLWLVRHDAPEAGVYLTMTLSLAYGLKEAVEGRIPLDHGSAWSLVQDLYDEKVTDFSERDIDALVQTYSLGTVQYRK